MIDGIIQYIQENPHFKDEVEKKKTILRQTQWVNLIPMFYVDHDQQMGQ